MAVPPEKIYCRGTVAPKLHDLDIDACHYLEELNRQMRAATDARTTSNQLAGLLLRERDEMLRRKRDQLHPSARAQTRA